MGWMDNFPNPLSSSHFLPILGYEYGWGPPQNPLLFFLVTKQAPPKTPRVFPSLFPSYQINATHRGASVEMHSKLTIGGL